jgi:hypothetical protein
MVRGDSRSIVRGRSADRARGWLGTITLLLALSFLPASWLAGWTADVAGFANVILTPSKHALTAVRHWLRPPPSVFAGEPEKLRELQLLKEEAIRRYRRLEIERDALEEKIALLERSKRASKAGDLTRLRVATVIGVTRPSARSAGALLLNIGGLHGVLPGMVASTDGELLVGRVADSVQRFGATVIPANGLSGFAVEFVPPSGFIDNPPRGVLSSRGDVWTVDLSQPGAIDVGWIAVVAEERWPRSALGLRAGVVESVTARDDAPLMRRITVRSFVDPLRVERVVLADEADAATERAAIERASGETDGEGGR